jgi:catechol 2,3-dioxygenase-like lactoylglutathione lyase family enzyme
MNHSIFQITLVVKDYDEAIAFYTGKLGFQLLQDLYIAEQDKRWVVVAPPGENGCKLLLAKASDKGQGLAVGNQTGGRVGFFLRTDDFWRDYEKWARNGVEFLEQPREETYGTVAVFRDLYGNLWDLLQEAD